LLKKLGQALAYNIGITAYAHKIRVPIPSWDEVDVKMLGQSGSCAPAEIHSNVEAMRLYRQRQGLFCFPYQFGQLQHLFITGLVNVGDVPGRRYEQMTIVVREAVEYHEAALRAPQHQVFIVILRVLQIMADKTLTVLV